MPPWPAGVDRVGFRSGSEEPIILLATTAEVAVYVQDVAKLFRGMLEPMFKFASSCMAVVLKEIGAGCIVDGIRTDLPSTSPTTAADMIDALCQSAMYVQSSALAQRKLSADTVEFSLTGGKLDLLRKLSSAAFVAHEVEVPSAV